MMHVVRLPKMVTLATLFALLMAPATQAQDSEATGPSLADITEAWLASPHADRTSEAFTHWNEDGEIPGTCAVCHSSTGAIDYVRGPLTLPGRIDHSVVPGTTIDCAVCHNAAAADLVSVPFPAGVSVDTFGSSAICAVCHQGRAFTGTVTEATAGMEDDAVIGDLSFINVHYKPSATTNMGSVVRGGFEYPDKVYKGQFSHVENLNTCADCHSPHTLQVNLESCTTCHQGVENFEDIRISRVDFDGDGDLAEGISDPIRTLHEKLGQAIQLYASEIAQSPVVYATSSYPYFFNDSDGDGAAAPDEAAYPNRFQSWTPRLLKAAYNYQLVAKETAIYTHNPHYALQLLYDSIESLNERVDIDMSGLTRP